MISLYNLTITGAVVLLAAMETKSLHSPKVMEDIKITTVVTRHTSRLSSTLNMKKKKTLPKRYTVFFYELLITAETDMTSQPTSFIYQYVYLMNLALGWTFFMRYLASRLLMQLNMAPSRPPTKPISTKKAKSTAVHK